MISYCPRCGAAYAVEVLGEMIRTNVRCPDCRLAPAEEPAMLAPAENEGDEIGYELDDWPVTDRGAVTAALMTVDIPYRWDPELVLVVPADYETQVDEIMDDLDAGEVAEEAGVDEPAEEETAEEETADGGEEAQEAMADLYVAADRLQHAPFDRGIGEDLKAAAARVAGSLPPYGIEPAVWRQIRAMATTVVTALEGGVEDEQVGTDTKALREFLRNYV